jgi:hypothetical protein
MTATSSKQFGYLIAYLLPGFIVLVGIAPLFPGLARWLRPVGSGDLGLGPPLYAVLGAMAMGLILSCFRWVFLDSAHHVMGVRRPVWNDGELQEVLEGFDYLVQSHYRYYEFTGNALLFAASRDALAKYYTRTGLLVGHVAEKAKRQSDV